MGKSSTSDHLQEALAQREQELVQSRRELAEARVEIGWLKQKLDVLARRLFGRKSEQLDDAQLQMLFQELSAPGPAEGKGSGPEAIEAPAPRPPQRASRSRSVCLPEHLPVLEEVIVPPEVKADPGGLSPDRRKLK